MIAPVRESQTDERPHGMHRARRMVATMLLSRRAPGEERIAAWKAWTLAGWVLVALAAYVAHQLGWY